MSIRKKILTLVCLVIILPMTFILLLSNNILNEQIEKAAQGYLQNASIIARNELINRLSEMKGLTTKTSKSPVFQSSIKQTNINDLNEIISDIADVYGYIDFYMIFDKERNLLTSKPKLKKTIFPRLYALLKKTENMHTAITSEEVFSLDDLFESDSEEYNKFKVLMDGSNEEKKEFLTKCLIGLAISPVYSDENNEQIGFFIVGDIANNDDYLPNIYSKSIQDSYLAISIEDIRIASNIRSPKKTNYIGSSIPVKINTIEGIKDGNYGRENVDGETHIFLDTPIINCDGDNVGVLGVGIPEYKFSIIMNIQRNIIVIVTIITLIFTIFIGMYFATKISEPIIIATELANEISRGNNEIAIDQRFLKGNNSETTILLKAFEKMACDLKKSEEERAYYLKNLETEHAEQQRLAEQLALLNTSLEEKVNLRTQDLREAVNSLKKAGEVKSLFLANMSHELKTPLSGIINSSQLLQEEIFGKLNDKQHKYIKNILNSGNHLLALINDILDICKIEAGKMTLTLGYYSISDILMEGFSIIKSLAYRKNIEVTINIIPSDFIIKVDANKLKQILCNLLSNAIKFTPEYGKVIVEVSRDDEYMHLFVKDNGIGIKEEDQVRIFNEFEQVDNSYEREYEGTGLGLPLVKKLIELHGGKILLISKLNSGTEVIVTLPLKI